MKSLKALLVALVAPSLVCSSVLQPRDQTISQCNADNCLRQLRASAGTAKPYCTSYLSNPHPHVYPVTVTSYKPGVPTVFHVGTGTAKSDYITRKLTPYTPPGQKKRALTDAPVPTPAPELEARQAALPPFASSCGGNTNRLSSACTCLIGNAPQTITKTAIQNQPGVYTTVGVCGATDGFDYNYQLQNQGGFENYYNGAKIEFDEFYEINEINACCKKCFRTPECATYNLDPDGPGCQLSFIVNSTELAPKEPNCPAGLAEIYAPFNDFRGHFGIGLCGYLLQSDE